LLASLGRGVIFAIECRDRGLPGKSFVPASRQARRSAPGFLQRLRKEVEE